MKKYIIFIIALLTCPIAASAAGLSLTQGGLGTTTVPFDYVLVGSNSSLRVTAVSTSSLGITGTGGSSASSTLLTDNNTFSGTNVFSNAASTFAGTWQGYNASTFNNKVSSTSLSVTTIGSSGAATYTPSTGVFNIPQYSGGTTYTATWPLAVTGTVISSATSSASSAGVLSAADWTTFNGKQATLSTPTLPLVLTGTTFSTLFSTTTNTGITINSLLTTNGSGVIVASSSIGNAQLQNNSIIVTTAAPLGGAATVSLGGTLALTCSTCATVNGVWPFTPTTYVSTAVQSTSTPLWLKATTPFSLMATSSYITYASSTAESTTNLFATYASTTETDATTLCLGGTCKTVWPAAGSTYTAYTPLAVNAGNVFSIATSSASQSGFISAADYQLLHTATTTAGTGLNYAGNAFSLKSYGATSTADTANQVSFFTSTNGTPWTIGGNSAFTFNPTGTLITFTNGSSTSFAVTGNSWHNGISYFGSTNQSNISATGVLTLGTALTVANGGTGASNLTGCLTGNGTGAITGSGTCNTSNATVSSVGLSDSNSTLTIGGTPVTTSGTLTATLNLGHSNTWTALQTINNASTTNLTVGTNHFSVWASGESVGYNILYGVQGQLDPIVGPGFELSTSTGWTATSSVSSAYGDTANIVQTWAGTFRTLACNTNTGTIEVAVTINGTTDYYPASTTAGTYTYSNTFTKGQALSIVAGNPASSPVWVSCSTGLTETP